VAKSFLSTFLSRRPPIRPLALLPSALNLHMTTAMTLRLVEKHLSRALGLRNFQPGPDQRSLSSFTINDRDPLRDSALRESQLSSLASSRNAFTGVHDLLTGVLPQISGCELLRLFGLGKFQNFPPSLSPRALSPEVYDPSTCVFWNQRSICTPAFGSFRPNATCHVFPH
jgi:hypothetical protein